MGLGNKLTVRRFYEQIVNTRDVSRISEIVSHEYTEMDGMRYLVAANMLGPLLEVGAIRVAGRAAAFELTPEQSAELDRRLQEHMAGRAGTAFPVALTNDRERNT
jgi:hypothetical protein